MVAGPGPGAATTACTSTQTLDQQIPPYVAAATASKASAAVKTGLRAPAVTPSRPGVLAAIGNTPMIELSSLSRATGCRILAKCEHLNPGGSVKDRAALWLVEAAEATGELREGGTIFEGTGGNTGVALCMVAAAKGYRAVMSMPAAISPEKIDAMRVFGAEVKLCPSVPFTDIRHYYHTAKAGAAATSGGWFANQFGNLNNAKAHIFTTGPEIWEQAAGRVDGFVCSAGTGGTVAGCSVFLKGVNPAVSVWLVDPMGSALFDYVRVKARGGSDKEAQVRRVDIFGMDTRMVPRSSGGSITEGIGIGRLTGNFRQAMVDGAFQGTDKEVVDMAYYLKRCEGVFVGPSAALNVVGAVKLARKLGPGHTIVTILCDGGDRSRSKMYRQEWLQQHGLNAPAERPALVDREPIPFVQ